jgi:hypothetical protein
MSIEFTVGDRTFRARKLPGLTQVRLLKRAAPVAGPLMAAAQFGDAEITSTAVSALSGLDDDAIEFVLAQTLSSVEMKIESGWAKISSSTDRLLLQYEEIGEDAYLMLSIAAHVLRYNFEPLFRAALSNLSDGATQTHLQ